MAKPKPYRLPPHLEPARRVADSIREQALALAPERTRDLVEWLEDTRNSMTQEAEVFAAIDARLVGASPIETAATDAAMHAVRWACFAEHEDAETAFGCMAEAAQALGMLRALVRPPEELREHLKAEGLSRAAAEVGAKGGRTRAARYAATAEEIRDLYAEWQAGRFTVPTSRKGRRLVRDFDNWAAEEFEVHPDTVAEYRLQKGGQ